MSLQRLVLTFKPEGVEIRTLYRSKDGHGPNTKARRRQVQDLTLEGLRRALASLEGRVDMTATSGFSQREDILLATTSPSEAKLVKQS
jgi:hypothetical protein